MQPTYKWIYNFSQIVSAFVCPQFVSEKRDILEPLNIWGNFKLIEFSALINLHSCKFQAQPVLYKTEENIFFFISNTFQPKLVKQNRRNITCHGFSVSRHNYLTITFETCNIYSKCFTINVNTVSKNWSFKHFTHEHAEIGYLTQAFFKCSI